MASVGDWEDPQALNVRILINDPHTTNCGTVATVSKGSYTT